MSFVLAQRRNERVCAHQQSLPQRVHVLAKYGIGVGIEQQPAAALQFARELPRRPAGIAVKKAQLFRRGVPRANPLPCRKSRKQKEFIRNCAELDLGRTATARFVLAYAVRSVLRSSPPQSAAPQRCRADD